MTISFCFLHFVKFLTSHTRDIIFLWGEDAMRQTRVGILTGFVIWTNHLLSPRLQGANTNLERQSREFRCGTGTSLAAGTSRNQCMESSCKSGQKSSGSCSTAAGIACQQEVSDPRLIRSVTVPRLIFSPDGLSQGVNHSCNKT